MKKSSFWFHNSKFYPTLEVFVKEHAGTLTNNSQVKPNYKNLDAKKNEDEIENFEVENTTSDMVTNPKTENSNKKFKIEIEKDEFDESEEEKQYNLIKFVQKQQEELCKNNNFIANESITENQNVNGLDLSLSASSSSLLTAFSKLSSSSNTMHSTKVSSIDFEKGSSSTESSINLNSDLEMEVASTLVDMKFFAVRNQPH